ncbi:MAG: hypothetical protein IPI74_07955 [Bacteroidales bacterium]|nr:hypothetical protein [Bacteroidales bacterium]
MAKDSGSRRIRGEATLQLVPEQDREYSLLCHPPRVGSAIGTWVKKQQAGKAYISSIHG